MNSIVHLQLPIALHDATDDALVSTIRAGSRPAVGELYKRHAPKLRAALRKARVRSDDADDIVQTVFGVLLNDPQFTPAPGRVGGWLQGIARRLAGRRRRELVQEAPTDADAMIADAIPRDEREEEDGLERQP